MKLTKEIKQSIPYQYAMSVAAGDIPTGKMMKLVVDRFFSWIKTAQKDGYYLDHENGMMVINFFKTCLNHTQGKLAGQPFVLAPFQQFCLYNVFAWKNKKTDLRRISTVYDKRAKKNGKTAEMAGVALFMMSFENESSSQVYVGATKEEQAKLCWKQAKDFIDHTRSNPVLRSLGFETKQREIIFKPLNSVMMPLGGDSKTQDGISAHLSIIDEYHAHRDDSVKENLESSSVMRQQPITYHITTAGASIGSVCYEYEQVCKDILIGLKEDDHTWIMIHDLDEGDDWQDETNWYKANPLLGQGLSVKNLRAEFTKAQNQPSKVPNFKTKHLNMWVNSMTSFFTDEEWMGKGNDATFSDDVFKELGCVLALDLSTNKDLTALSAVSYPDENGVRYHKALHFCPKKTILLRSKEDGIPYQSFADEGLIIPTPGDRVDYTVVERYATQWYEELGADALEIDSWNANSVDENLTNKGLLVREFAQNIRHMNVPCKTFENLVLDGKWRHGGNRLLRWQIGGLVAKIDLNENLKFDKKDSRRRIDGIISGVMALGGTMTPVDTSNLSKYNDANQIQF
ncbi:terminase large subunit [Nonlabens sp. SCSIO 43208]|uniref:terminase large subunit n=1 Tax=Nonlabens sp. SCSIO 43208 TaxID=2793009 RepID=UPI003D6A3BD9